MVVESVVDMAAVAAVDMVANMVVVSPAVYGVAP